MTVYNDERFVGAAVESILGQRLADFELIIVDDGSTDGTPQILQALAARDARIRLHRQANAGTTAAANAGLALARGPYVARLDSDDRSLPDRLTIEAEWLDRHPEVALVGGGSEIIDRDGTVIGRRNIHADDPARTLRHRCIFQQSDVMFRTEIARRLGGYRAKFRNCQDYDLWLRFSEVASITKLNVILGQWRLNEGGYTVSRRLEQRRESDLVRQMAAKRRQGFPDGYEDYEPPPAPAHRRPVSEADYAALVGLVLLQALRPREARPHFRRALQGGRRKALAALALSYLPAPALMAILRGRDAWLNGFGRA